ncbi:MAG: hypothetical protein GXO86_02320 [Chlorobi bacterium]|nr:hypothetical protein [Chlorobiota bacterium]
MNKKQLLDEIFAILSSVREDKEKLEIIHRFFMDEIYEEPERIEIPEKYKKLVADVAENILAGLICYINPDTLEVEDVPRMMIEDPLEYELTTGASEDDWGLKSENWENRIAIEPMEPHEAFRIMERFVDIVDDSHLQRQLINALNRRSPFANFKYIVEGSEYRQQWFDFRQQETEEYVYDILSTELENYKD